MGPPATNPAASTQAFVDPTSTANILTFHISHIHNHISHIHKIFSSNLLLFQQDPDIRGQSSLLRADAAACILVQKGRALMLSPETKKKQQIKNDLDLLIFCIVNR